MDEGETNCTGFVSIRHGLNFQYKLITRRVHIHTHTISYMVLKFYMPMGSWNNPIPTIVMLVFCHLFFIIPSYSAITTSDLQIYNSTNSPHILSWNQQIFINFVQNRLLLFIRALYAGSLILLQYVVYFYVLV